MQVFNKYLVLLLCTLSFTNPLYAQNPLQKTGPQFYYPFNGSYKDSISGKIARNYKPLFCDDKNLKPKTAIVLNENTGPIELPVSVSTASFTFSCWYRSSSNTFTLLSCANSTNFNELLVGCDNSGKLTVSFHDKNGENTITYSELPTDNSWHMLSITAGEDFTKMYLDSALIEAEDVGTEKPLDFNSLWLGARQTCLNGCWDQASRFKGGLDEVYFYNRILSDEEIKSLYLINSIQPDNNLALRGITKVNPTPTTAGSAIATGKYYAVIIAVQDYLDNSINDLDNPIQDAEKLSRTLLTKYLFTDSTVLLLKNPKREDIIRQFDLLTDKMTEQDNLLIFYAGHGYWDEKLKQGYWLPIDATKTNRGSWFSNADLKTYIGGISSKHTLLIADACFGGSIFKTRDAFGSSTTAINELYKLPSRKAMTSGAMKTVPDKSVFTEYLIKRLNENTEKYISTEQLFSSFKTAVINNSPNGQVPQFGDIRETGDEGGDFIFILK